MIYARHEIKHIDLLPLIHGIYKDGHPAAAMLIAEFFPNAIHYKGLQHARKNLSKSDIVRKLRSGNKSPMVANWFDWTIFAESKYVPYCLVQIFQSITRIWNCWRRKLKQGRYVSNIFERVAVQVC